MGPRCNVRIYVHKALMALCGLRENKVRGVWAKWKQEARSEARKEYTS